MHTCATPIPFYITRSPITTTPTTVPLFSCIPIPVLHPYTSPAPLYYICTHVLYLYPYNPVLHLYYYCTPVLLYYFCILVIFLDPVYVDYSYATVLLLYHCTISVSLYNK